MLRSLAKAVAHPFFFAACPVIICFTQARLSVPVSDACVALLLMEVIVAVCFAVLMLFLKSAAKAGLVCSVALLPVFSYRFLFHLTQNLFGVEEVSVPVLLFFFFMLIMWCTIAARDSIKCGKLLIPIDHQSLCQSLNAVSAALVVINVVPLIGFEAEQEKFNKSLVAKAQAPFASVKFSPGSAKPDIYYIILDAYCNPLSLKQFWGYDDSEFIAFLENKGFFIASKAMSNYDNTTSSCSSTLNMQYLDFLPDSCLHVDPRDPNNKDVTFARLIQESFVMSFLKRDGYKIVNVGSVGLPFDYMPQADVNLQRSYASDFLLQMAMLTPLISTEQYCPILRDVYNYTRLTAEEKMPEAVKILGPKFVMVHVNLPHPPFLLDESGPVGSLTVVGAHTFESKDGYLRQVKVANRLAKQLVTQILNAPGPKPIILIQGDHGSWFYKRYPLHTAANEQMRILSAYYFPGNAAEKALYESVTPVNTFRIILNSYMGTKLPLLPDRSFLYRAGNRGSNLVDVTSEINFDETLLQP